MDPQEFRPISRLRIYLGTAAFAGIMSLFAYLLWPNDRVVGILQSRSFQYEESLRRLLRSHELNPRDTTVLLQLRGLYNVLGQPESEIHYLQQYLDIRSRDSSVRLDLAQVYLWNLQPEMAREQYEKILDYDPHNVEVLRKLANSYGWEQKYESAIDCYRQLEQLKAMTLSDYRGLIRVYVGTQRLDEAAPVFEIIWKLAPQQITLEDYQNLADIYLWNNQPAKADNLLLEMLDTFGRSDSVKESYLGWYMAKRMTRKAIGILDEWITLNPRDVELRSRQVSLYLEDGRTTDAIQALEKLIALQGSRPEHKLQLYWIYFDSGEYAKAVELARTIPSSLMNSEDVWPSLADIHVKLGEFDSAIRILRQWLQLYPDRADLRQSLAWIYRDTGNDTAALEEVNWLLARYPDRHDVIAIFLEIKSAQGEHALVLEWANKGLVDRPTSQNYLEKKVASLFGLKQPEKALEPLALLTRMYPANLHYALDLSDVHLRLGRRDEALGTLDKLWMEHGSDSLKALDIARAYAYADHAPRALEIFKDLEAREPGDQYSEDLIQAALQSKDLVTAERLLRQRIEEKYELFKTIDTLRVAYEEMTQHEKELELLAREDIHKVYAEKFILERRATLLEYLNRIPEALVYHEELYALKPDETRRARMLEIVRWVEGLDLKLAVYDRYARPGSAESLVQAELHYQARHLDRARSLLAGLPADLRSTYKVLELSLYLAHESGDLNSVRTALDRLLSQGSVSPDKRPAFLIDRAQILANLGERDAAMSDALSAHAAGARTPALSRLLANLTYETGEYKASVPFLLELEDRNEYEEFMLGAAWIRMGGTSEGPGREIFQKLLAKKSAEHTFARWQMELDVAYALQDEQKIDRAWEVIMKDFYRPDLLPRYALHLYYSGREDRAWHIYVRLRPNENADYLDLTKAIDPEKYRGPLNWIERREVAQRYVEKRDWYRAVQNVVAWNESPTPHYARNQTR